MSDRSSHALTPAAVAAVHAALQRGDDVAAIARALSLTRASVAAIARRMRGRGAR